MPKQITDIVLMIRPVAFAKNDETAVNNYYQQSLALSAVEIERRAEAEFDNFVALLRKKEINVLVIDDTASPHTPDSIFPNNWVSFHEDGSVILYPMFAENRRQERRGDVLDELSKKFAITQEQSLTDWEKYGQYLEGTGSLILDRVHKVAYAALSERTQPAVLDGFERLTGYSTMRFLAMQSVGGIRKQIYHTNVMMFVGEKVAVLCADCIDDRAERAMVIDKLTATGKELVLITEEQVNQFAGNMLQVANSSGQKFVVMSAAAYHCLSKAQEETLRNHGEIIYSDLSTIETLGGGSARCMMAEVFLPPK